MPTNKLQLSSYVTKLEYAEKVRPQANKANLSIGNLIRVKLGLPPLKQGRPKNP